MTYYLPDSTGLDPECAVANDLYTIFTPNQRIVFGKPIFLTGLTLSITGTTTVPMVQGTDWSFDPTIDVDYTAMSRMKNYDSSFSMTLLRSIQLISPTPQPYQISCDYQQLYPVLAQVAIAEGDAITLTPALLSDMLRRLANVELELTEVTPVTATTQTNPMLLALDPNKTNTSNVVTDSYVVNTYGGQNLIKPTCGAFFADSLTVSLPTNPVTLLTKDVDYVIFGCDRAKTKATTNASGVYNFILLTRPYAGTVTLGYHAYGGDVTLYDMTAVYQQISNVNTYLTTAQFVTATELGSNPVVASLTSRIATMETTVRNLINAGQPNYSDVTGNGTAAVQKLRSVDTNLHWWSIATLYTVAGSSQAVTADRMHLRLQMLNAHVSADVFINVDLSLPNPFEIDAIAVNQPLGYVPFTAYGTAPVCTPQFRIVYNSSMTTPSGIVLQIGLELPGLTETVSLQDLSGSESCWILLPSNATSALPMDTAVVLPNATYTWQSGVTGSQQNSHMMPNKSGYLAWGGTLPVSTMSTTINALTPLLDSSFLISDITKVTLQFTTSDTTTCLTVEVPVESYTTPTAITGSAILQNVPLDGTNIIFQVSVVNQSGTLSLSLTPNRIPAGTTLVLRHVFFMLD